ncbi:hypothetical protein DIPPA_05357 [Diplonema papillatum]|nr:hypothetical protein DIPPA_05357 [Diplonema papillatum]
MVVLAVVALTDNVPAVAVAYLVAWALNCQLFVGVVHNEALLPSSSSSGALENESLRIHASMFSATLNTRAEYPYYNETCTAYTPWADASAASESHSLSWSSELPSKLGVSSSVATTAASMCLAGASAAVVSVAVLWLSFSRRPHPLGARFRFLDRHVFAWHFLLNVASFLCLCAASLLVRSLTNELGRSPQVTVHATGATLSLLVWASALQFYRCVSSGYVSCVAVPEDILWDYCCRSSSLLASHASGLALGGLTGTVSCFSHVRVLTYTDCAGAVHDLRWGDGLLIDAAVSLGVDTSPFVWVHVCIWMCATIAFCSLAFLNLICASHYWGGLLPVSFVLDLSLFVMTSLAYHHFVSVEEQVTSWAEVAYLVPMLLIAKLLCTAELYKASLHARKQPDSHLLESLTVALAEHADEEAVDPLTQRLHKAYGQIAPT